MADNFQRIGSVSNAHVGRDFETTAIGALADAGIVVTKNYPVEIGVAATKKRRQFDLGSDSPLTIVECKSHRWTASAKVPSAKLTVWNEAMYYFSCAPSEFRKILFVLRDVRATTSETLSDYYVRTFGHMIPPGVEIWEFDESTGQAKAVYPT